MNLNGEIFMDDWNHTNWFSGLQNGFSDFEKLTIYVQ